MNAMPQLEPQEVEVPPVMAAQLPSHSPTAPSVLTRTMGAAFGALTAYVEENRLTHLGPPRALYKSFDQRETQFVVAFPVAAPDGPLEGERDIKVDRLPGGKALRFTHKGSYRDLRKTYEAISSWMAGAGLLESQGAWARYMPVWEEYLNDPQTTPQEELITQIYIPMDHAKL
ncbi:MAG: GyrI-like domain-containing protein [Rhodothermales bacterium]